MANTISFDSEKARYEIFVDGTFAGHVDAQDTGDVVEMPHTIILDEFGGQGLARELVTYALDDLRAQDRKIVPECTYVQGFIEKNPSYADLVA